MIVLDTLEEAKKIGGEKLVLEARIKKTKRGRFELRIEVIETGDELTGSVFIYKENQVKYIVRDTETKNSNVFYVEPNSGEISSEIFEQEFDTFEEALEQMFKILNEVEEKRKRIRETRKEYHKFIVI